MVTQPVDIVMEMGSLPELPWTLLPGEELDFLVSYIPTNVGMDESQISIQGSDPRTPEINTTQVGIGDVEHSYAEHWIQEKVSVIDILWVVDDSGSMMPFQQNLSSNISSFLNIFVSRPFSFPDPETPTISSLDITPAALKVELSTKELKLCHVVVITAM